MLPDQIRESLSSSDLCEWAVYLNSPFSSRGREAMMNGWLVHTIRSIMADKRHRPKFSDSMFPFEKIAKEFFERRKAADKTAPVQLRKGQPKTAAEVAHLTQVFRKDLEKMRADYKAGKIPNKAGLYYGETLRK